ncbi:MAG: bifunctional metallophosphatase/5'-nucleotidase [Alphaproteobacteria bacterium]|jgi:2',3'-cyclic-nucleotide 2'-phosphodiesterase (5'-nucleotidase family)|nr:bifunctional metallophosphatase/5'-nucleotidase [Alphaproteobacteria bacterium]
MTIDFRPAGARRPAFVAATATAVGLVLAAGTALAEPATITILHVNDIDRMSPDDGRGGVAKVAAVVEAARAEGGNVLFTNGGDNISPSLLSGFDQGAHMIDLMNAAGVDIGTLGNHEFDFGPDVAKERMAEAEWTIVSSNVVGPDGAIIDGAVPTHTMEMAGYTLGFIGLTTAGTMVKSSPGDHEMLEVTEVAATLADELRAEGVDLVVAITHTDLSEDEALRTQGAVDLILSGDDHILFAWWNGAVAFAESASQGDYVTEITLSLDRDDDGDLVWSPAFWTIDTLSVEPDPEVAALVQGYEDQLSAELDVEIGVTETEIDSRRASVRGGETAIGNLITDAMRTATGADVAITNGGGIRADRIYEPGTTLTRRDIQSELPFGNKTISMEVSGADIVAALENGFSAIEDVSGRFPHVSGMSVVYDPSAEPGSRVVEVTVDGAPIDPDATYVLATNDFMGRGGDGYEMFADAPRVIDELAGQLMAGQVMDYVADQGTVAPTVEGRLVAQ